MELQREFDEFKDNRLYDSEGYVRVVTISDIKERLKMLRPYFDIVLYIHNHSS